MNQAILPENLLQFDVLAQADSLASPIDRFVHMWTELNSLRVTKKDFERVVAQIDWHEASFEQAFSEETTAALETSAAASDHVDHRSDLGLSRSFAPSVELLKMWSERIDHLATKSGRERIDLAIASASTTERAQQFSEMLFSLLGSYGQFLRYHDESDVNLTRGSSFIDEFQFAILDCFQIVPDRAHRFNRLLLHDMRAAMTTGWLPSGEWGQLELTAERTISYRLKAVKMFEDDDFVVSEDGD